MARDFEDFAADAAELFGLDKHEASDLLGLLHDQEDFEEDSDRLKDFMPEAFDLLEDVTDLELYEEDWWDFSLDPDWPDDEWLDEGVEYEITADYEEIAA